MPIIALGLLALGLVFLQFFAYKRWWNHRFDFAMRFNARDAFVGDTITLRTEITNRKLLPLPWIHARAEVSQSLAPVGGGQLGSGLFSVMPYTAVRRRNKFICTKRGVYRLTSAKLFARDLLHLGRFDADIKLRGELLVFPQLLESTPEMSAILTAVDSHIQSNRIINPDPFVFKGIREYQPTDPLKAINFKATAVAQQLMVNVYAPTDERRCTLLLNFDREFPLSSSDPYEHAIRICATIAQHLITQGADVALATNGRDSITARPIRLHGGASPAHLYKIFECLARVNSGNPALQMANEIQALTDRERLYILISPYATPELHEAIKAKQARGFFITMA
jgi:uncharacterized protein (DUF58 family)